MLPENNRFANRDLDFDSPKSVVVVDPIYLRVVSRLTCEEHLLFVLVLSK